MINFILGEAGTGKSACLIQKIKEYAGSDKKIFVIIPEQFSFEYERKMYNELGSIVSNKINVLSFTRLARTIFDTFGNMSGEYADDNTKTVIMYLALSEIQKSKSLTCYTKQAGSRAFINDLLEVVTDLRHASVIPEKLASGILSADDRIREKALDLSLIYSAYDRILREKGYRDGLTDITEAAALANINEYFEDSVLFIDEFDNFSVDELEMIEVAVSECSDMYISLCTPETEKKDFSLFTTVNGTYSQIKHIAAKYEKQHQNILLDKRLRFKNSAVEQISRSVFRKKEKTVPADDLIRITEAKDLYQEADFVCSQIKYLVFEKGYRYGEISVAARQLSDYDMILKAAMDRYDIPYFFGTQRPVMHTSVVIMITSLIELAGSKKISTDTLIKYAKTMLTSLGTEEISEIENFCYKWNIDGDMWNECFSETSLVSSEDEKYLKYMDSIRERLVVPIIRLREKCRGQNVSVICRNIYGFIETQKIISGIEHLINDYNKKQLTDMASEIYRIYNSIMDIFTVMTNLMGEETLPVNVFGELFTLVLRRNKFLNPPQKLDIVSVVSAEKARLENQKVLFVMGANEGILPYSVKQNGILSDTDRESFARIGIELGKDTKTLLTDERFSVYRLLSAVSERIYITYPLSDAQGGARYPSYILAQISTLFSDNIKTYASDYDILFYSPTKKSAYYNYVQNIAKGSEKTASLRAALMSDDEYRGKIEYLDSLKPGADHHIEDSRLINRLMSDRLLLSATSYEEYNLCHFKYYCHYALRIAARGQKEINLLELGNLVHMCLEKIFSGCASKDEFLKLTDEQITAYIDEFSAEYKEKNLGGDFGKNIRLNKKFERLTEDTLTLVNHLKEELRNSKFVPEKYEFEISEKNGVRPVTLKTGEGIEIVLSGKIDRVDTFEDNGEKFIRIVDYKTGTKVFSLNNVIFGIDMQMLLYLFSITGEEGPFGASVPAGVLYMPSGKIPLDRARSDTDGLSKHLNKYYHMSGVLLKELKVLRAMEEDIEGIFIPARLTSDARKKGTFDLDSRISSCLTRPQFERLRKHTLKLITDMAKDLYSGNISASPLNFDKNRNVCSYCDYRDICGNFPRIRERILPDNIDEITKEILGEEE